MTGLMNVAISDHQLRLYYRAKNKNGFLISRASMQFLLQMIL